MKIVYFSLTGNNVRFIKKTQLTNQAICIKSDLKMNEDFILLTSTVGIGEIPLIVKEFLEYENNAQYLRYTVGSGNKNWGHRYCQAAKDIATMYGVENIFNFELAGNEYDVKNFLEIYKKIKCEDTNESIH